VEVGDEARLRKTAEGESGVGGIGTGGTEKNHKSEEGYLVPVRKGRVEESESKTETEVGVETARP
jgi:hypothetical protein